MHFSLDAVISFSWSSSSSSLQTQRATQLQLIQGDLELQVKNDCAYAFMSALGTLAELV